jgi:hypothetical protein
VEAVKKFEGWGLTFHRPEGEQVRLPSDITQVTSDELGKIFTELTAWTDYIASQVTLAQLEERTLLKKKEYMENTMFVRRMGATARGERVTTVKAEIASHQDVVDLDNEYEEKYAYRKLVEMLLTNHERDLSLVSREITRRSNEARFLRKDY